MRCIHCRLCSSPRTKRLSVARRLGSRYPGAIVSFFTDIDAPMAPPLAEIFYSNTSHYHHQRMPQHPDLIPSDVESQRKSPSTLPSFGSYCSIRIYAVLRNITLLSLGYALCALPAELKERDFMNLVTSTEATRKPSHAVGFLAAGNPQGLMTHVITPTP